MRRRFPLLLRRGRFLSRESLPSFVVRLAQLNYYDPVTILTKLCLPGPEKDRLDWPSKGETYEHLFSLTWLDPYRIHDATGHYFAKVFTLPGVQIESIRVPGGSEVLPILASSIIRKQLRPESAAQFCPLCLRKTPYHRVEWMPVALAACVKHKRLLVDRCPECQSRVSVRAIVANCQCQRCGTDLRKVRSAWLGEDKLGLVSQRFMRSWLKISRSSKDFLSYGLPRLSSRVLFHIVDGLVEGLKKLGSQWDFVHRPMTKLPMEPFEPIRGKPTPAQSYRLYATAFMALVNWPHGFYDFLRTYKSREHRTAKIGVYEDLGFIYFKLLEEKWSHPAFGIVQAAVDRYLVDEYATPPSVQPMRGEGSPGQRVFTYISSARAARLLGVSSLSLKRLLDAELLVRRKWKPRTPNQYALVRRDEVLVLRQKWRRATPLADAAKWLGLTQHTTIGLVRVGLLAARHRQEEDERTCWLFDKQELDHFYCQTVGRRGDSERIYSSKLTAVAQALSVMGLDTADIFKLIADGELTSAIYGKSPALAWMIFDRSEIDAILKNSKSGQGLLDSRESAHRLGAGPWTFLRWLDDELLSAVVEFDYEEYFYPDQLDRFLADHVFIEEAGEILDMVAVLVEELVLEGRLQPVWGTELFGSSRYLFRRENVEKLRIEILRDRETTPSDSTPHRHPSISPLDAAGKRLTTGV